MANPSNFFKYINKYKNNLFEIKHSTHIHLYTISFIQWGDYLPLVSLLCFFWRQTPKMAKLLIHYINKTEPTIVSQANNTYTLPHMHAKLRGDRDRDMSSLRAPKMAAFHRAVSQPTQRFTTGKYRTLNFQCSFLVPSLLGSCLSLV